MPNHVVNVLTIEAPTEERLKELLSLIGGVDEEGNSSPISFQRFAPRPEGFDWYKWNLRHWGTKWDAYETSIDGNVIRFWTAWSTPSTAMMELSWLFEDCAFEIEYADEDIGFNCGRYRCEKGRITGRWHPEGSDAVSFSLNLWGIEKDSE